MLGSDLVAAFKHDYEVVGLCRPEIDVTDKILCDEVLQEVKPDIVINTAAYHKVPDSQKYPNLAFGVNAIGAFNIAQSAKSVSAKSVYISTDYVFDGSKDFFDEYDNPNPLNVYGASKLAGEFLTKIGNDSSYVIRTSWLFGINQEHSSKGLNFISQILKKAVESEKIEVVSDQIGSPTYTVDLSIKIKELLEKDAPYGTYHITNSNFCSWYEFAKEIIKLSGSSVKVCPINSENMTSEVVRPKRSVMNSKRLSKVKVKPLRSWTDAVKDYIAVNKLYAKVS